MQVTYCAWARGVSRWLGLWLKLVLLAASSEPGALDAKPVESPGDPNQLTRKGRKRKTVTWPEEGKLREYFYFELDETERGILPALHESECSSLCVLGSESERG